MTAAQQAQALGWMAALGAAAGLCYDLLGRMRRGWLTAGAAGNFHLSLPALPTNRWLHLAVVLDAAHRSLLGYVDGVNAGAITNLPLTMEHLANAEDGNFNRVFLGRGADDATPRLNALVRDFRIYSIALSEAQIEPGNGG